MKVFTEKMVSRTKERSSAGTDCTCRAVVPSASEMDEGGFSLVELMSGMAILMVMVTLMGVVFTSSNKVWTTGTGRAGNSTDGRAALAMLAHDLQYAVADGTNGVPQLTCYMGYDRNNLFSYGFTNSEICFVSLENDPSSTSPRTAEELEYYVLEDCTNPHSHTYSLYRGSWPPGNDLYSNPTTHCYYNPTWYQNRPPTNSPIARNVVGFAVYAMPYFATSDVRMYRSSDPYTDPSGSTVVSNRMPMYVDMYLEVLNDDDSVRAANMVSTYGSETDPTVLKFIEQNERRYSTRVYFLNQNGYNPRLSRSH